MSVGLGSCPCARHVSQLRFHPRQLCQAQRSHATVAILNLLLSIFRYCNTGVCGITALVGHLGGPVVAAVRVDGNTQPRTELAEVGICHDVREHASPLVHLVQRTHSRRCCRLLTTLSSCAIWAYLAIMVGLIVSGMCSPQSAVAWINDAINQATCSMSCVPCALHMDRWQTCSTSHLS